MRPPPAPAFKTPGQHRKLITGLLVLGLLGILGLHFYHASRLNTVAQQYSTLSARLVSFEKAASALQQQLAERSSGVSPSDIQALKEWLDAESGVLSARIGAVETQLAALSHDAQAGEFIADSEPLPSARPAVPLSRSADSGKTEAPLIETHAAEAGTSEWGIDATERIADAFQASPFFAQHGGELTSDCRQTQCVVEWYLPALSRSPEEERHFLAGMGRLELMALATQNAQDVGRIQPVPARDGSADRLTVYFRRAEDAMTE